MSVSGILLSQPEPVPQQNRQPPEKVIIITFDVLANSHFHKVNSIKLN